MMLIRTGYDDYREWLDSNLAKHENELMGLNDETFEALLSVVKNISCAYGFIEGYSIICPPNFIDKRLLDEKTEIIENGLTTLDVFFKNLGS